MQSTLLTHGSLQGFPKSTVLTAGELTVLYENGFLRYIGHGDTEIIRMINLTVRDHNWNTIVPEILSEKIESSADSFVIEYQARCHEGIVDFLWKCIIRGNADSTISFSAEGKAVSAFRRNRVGITVLHPIESCTGKDCVITHPDRTTQTEKFPLSISPTQPFFSIRSMAWSPAEGIKAVIDFEGEVFETEDQRNWLDASYKTYCTPLSIPFPVSVSAGDEVKQSIQLQVKSQGKSSVSQRPITFALDNEKRFPFPKIGIPISRQSHTEEILNRIRALQVDFLRVDANVSDPGCADTLQQAATIAASLKCPLEVVLFVNENIPDNVVQYLLPLAKQIQEFIVLPATAKSAGAQLILNNVTPLRKHFPGCRIGSGTDAFFTELNRSRTPPEHLDFLTFSVNPQVHAFDVRTMTENLQGHRYVVESCREFAGGKAIHVGPVTLKMRANPNATSRAEEISGSGATPSYVDSRQLSLYAAGWTMGSFKYLAENGVEAITFYQTCGWAGLVSHPDEPWPDQYAVPSRCVYPVYLLIQELLRHKGKFIRPLISSHPLVMDGVAFADAAGKETILLANLTADRQHIQFPLKGFTARVIDSGNIGALMEGTGSIEQQKPVPVKDSISLPPFSFVVANE